MDTIELPRDELGQHVIGEAYENGDVEEWVDGDIEWNYDWEVEYVDAYEGDETELFRVEVGGKTKGTETRRTSIGSRHHPPEYESTTVYIEGHFVMEVDLDGWSHYSGTVEIVDGGFGEPDYEAQWRDV